MLLGDELTLTGRPWCSSARNNLRESASHRITLQPWWSETKEEQYTVLDKNKVTVQATKYKTTPFPDWCEWPAASLPIAASALFSFALHLHKTY